MKDIFIFEGKNYISARRASEISEYSSDYIGQLCRAEKLDCRMVGRAWFVTLESIDAHKKHVLEVESDPSRVENIRPRRVVPLTTVPVLASSPVLTADPVSKPSTSHDRSALIYGSEDAPLLPVLNKVSSLVSPMVAPVSSSAQVAPVSSSSTSSSPVEIYSSRSLFSSRRIAATVIVVLIVVVGALAGHVVFTDTRTSSPQVASASGVIGSIVSFFDHSVDSILAFFGYSHEGASDIIAQNNTAPQLYNGMAIIPSDTTATDAQTKQRVRESFSDQVEVHPDQSGTAGVVKPVFKESKGDDFVYVLVPVNENKSP